MIDLRIVVTVLCMLVNSIEACASRKIGARRHPIPRDSPALERTPPPQHPTLSIDAIRQTWGQVSNLPCQPNNHTPIIGVHSSAATPNPLHRRNPPDVGAGFKPALPTKQPHPHHRGTLIRRNTQPSPSTQSARRRGRFQTCPANQTTTPPSWGYTHPPQHPTLSIDATRPTGRFQTCPTKPPSPLHPADPLNQHPTLSIDAIRQTWGQVSNLPCQPNNHIPIIGVHSSAANIPLSRWTGEGWGEGPGRSGARQPNNHRPTPTHQHPITAHQRNQRFRLDFDTTSVVQIKTSAQPDTRRTRRPETSPRRTGLCAQLFSMLQLPTYKQGSADGSPHGEPEATAQAGR